MTKNRDKRIMKPRLMRGFFLSGLKYRHIYRQEYEPSGIDLFG